MSNNPLFNATTAVEVNDDLTMLWIFLSGILIFFMQAGFTWVESGFTRSKNVVNISMKNILDNSVGTLSYRFIGLRVSEEVEIKRLDQSEYVIGGFEGGGFEAWIKDNTNTLT